jgi:hypothetical protein
MICFSSWWTLVIPVAIILGMVLYVLWAMNYGWPHKP